MFPSRSPPQPQTSTATEGRGLMTPPLSSLPPLQQDCLPHSTARLLWIVLCSPEGDRMGTENCRVRGPRG